MVGSSLTSDLDHQGAALLDRAVRIGADEDEDDAMTRQQLLLTPAARWWVALVSLGRLPPRLEMDVNVKDRVTQCVVVGAGRTLSAQRETPHNLHRVGPQQKDSAHASFCRRELYAPRGDLASADDKVNSSQSNRSVRSSPCACSVWS